MATLKDIAMVAGVTVDTVSRALNHKGKENWPSSLRRAEKIRKLAVDLGYFPNAAARAVKTGRFGQIACVVSEYRWHRGEQLFTGRLHYADSVAECLAERGYSTIMEPFYVELWTDAFIGASRLFSEIAVDGIVGVELCGHILPEIDRRIRDMGAPVVWLNRSYEDDIPSVQCDEAAGARMLVEHLVGLGHRRIGYLGIRSRHYSSLIRENTISFSLAQRGLDTSNMVAGEGEYPAIVDVAMRLLKTQPRPTAIICNDRARYDLLLHVACGLGLRVPADLSLCCFAGFRDILVAGHPITAAAIPEDKIAKVGVNCLIDQIEKRQMPGKIPPIAPTLHVGATTAPPGNT